MRPSTLRCHFSSFFFFNDTATTEIYTLSLHDALPISVRLSSADAVRRAAGEAPTVALATLRTDEADAQVRQARSALLPSLSVAGVWVNRDFNSQSLGIPFPPAFSLPNPVPPFNNYDGRVTVTQTLFDWSNVTRVRAASARADGSRAERGVTVETAAQAAAVAYLRASRAQAVVAARQADSSIAAELVTLAEAQKAAGVSAAIDVTRARTQLVRAEGLLIVARNERDRGRIVLARTLGIDPATPLRSEEHTSELQSRLHLVCRLLLEKKKNTRPICQQMPRQASLT